MCNQVEHEIVGTVGMLIVRGIEVGKIKIGDLSRCLVRILLKDLVVTLEPAEYRRRALCANNSGTKIESTSEGEMWSE